MPALEVVKYQKWGVGRGGGGEGGGSPTVVTYIHRLSSPPPRARDIGHGHSSDTGIDMQQRHAT